MSPCNILFKLSGSVAAYKSCFVISKLVQQGHRVQVVCTPNALKFIGLATLEGLTGRSVFTDPYATDQMMDHIHLARWADITILCPATANTMAKMVQGYGDDSVTTLFLAHEFKEKPYIIVPAMNQAMWQHPATQNSVATLQSWGVQFILPEIGYQACGESGPGRLAEPETILTYLTTLMVAK
jgi:phosphopantothenoylcysteine decarboxylase/phosphopantothenate--cysteine ligase